MFIYRMYNIRESTMILLSKLLTKSVIGLLLLCFVISTVNAGFHGKSGNKIHKVNNGIHSNHQPHVSISKMYILFE